jgi:DNA-3-methyladenine glycosylase
MKSNPFTPLPKAFYEPSAAVVARELLGHWLIRDTPEGPCGGAIVETEAYLMDDPACHAWAGMTRRNRVMFGPPGRAYVYFIYGCHYCVNAVCRMAGVGEAVLVRAIEPDFGLVQLRQSRATAREADLTNGPAKLCEAMRINRSLDGADLCDPASPLFVAENPSWRAFREERGSVVTTPRIGITKAATLPLRFYLKDSRFVSRRSGNG